MKASEASTPTKTTMDFEAETSRTVSHLSVAAESAACSDRTSWVLPFLESTAGLPAFEDELLLKTGKPTVDILAQCVQDTLHQVKQQKSNEKGAVESSTEKFVETGTLFLEKYDAWKASLEDEDTDVCVN